MLCYLWQYLCDVHLSRGQMSSWCGTRRTLMMSSRPLYPQPTSGCLIFSSMSCEYLYHCYSISLVLIHTDSLLTLPVCNCAVWTWGSLQIFLMSMWHMTDWCATTSPSRWWQPALSTSTTFRLMCKNVAWPSRAGSTPVRPPTHFSMYHPISALNLNELNGYGSNCNNFF